MASLTGQSVASSYEQLLHVDRDGGGNGTTLVDIKDGDNGTTFALQLATGKINVNGSGTFTGDVAIGDSVPLARLHAQDSSSGAVQAFIINTNGGTNSSADLAFGTWSGAVPTGTGNPGPQAKISAINTDSGTAATDLVFSTYGSAGTSSEKMRITNAGVVELTSGQLKFPASQNASSDANTLDDYEEGTWTATDGSGAGLSFTLENNAYVKIGKLVTASAIVTFPSTSNSSSALLTLPFNASSISSASGGTVLEQNINSAKAYVMAVDVANGVKIREFGSTTQTNANLSGKKLRFIITYHAS